MRNSTFSPQKQPRRLMALALLALLGAATLAEQVHEWAVRHVECPTHPGEYVHAERGAAQAGDAEPGPGVRGVPTATESHRHEHGALAFFASAAPVHPPGAFIRAAASVRAQRTVVERLIATRRLWQLAPKSSPPLS